MGIKIGGDLGKWSENVKDTIVDVGEKAEDIYENTVEDIRDIFKNIGDCAKAFDQIRLKVTHRYIEYHTMMIRELSNINYLSTQFINTIYKLVESEIHKDIIPDVYYLPNPNDPNSAQKIDINNYPFPTGKYPCVFIHGMMYAQNIENAYSFFKDFNDNVEVFPSVRYKDYDVYLVSYDTELTDEIEAKIIAASSVLIDRGSGPVTLFVLAVFWRELEKRAKQTGDYIKNFLYKISQLYDVNNNIYPRGFCLSHSLGSFTFAYAANELCENNENVQAFQNWLCMAAAIPANAFTRTGDFEYAPRIAGAPDGPSYGTSVWYSRMDWILNGAYSLVNGHLAMGTSGALENFYSITPMDVTTIAREAHSDNYFERLKSIIKDEVFF
jgi:hypothetical protein